MNLLYPRIRKGSIGSLIKTALLGAIVAGVYGIIHDQITYTISPEYFTRFKFEQFSYADLGLGERAFVIAIGFLATWWVGFFAGWFLWRLGVDKYCNPPAIRNIIKRFTWIIASGLVCGSLGFCYAKYRLQKDAFEDWLAYSEAIGVVDHGAFMTVGQIHNFGYLGALIGLVIAGIAVRRERNRRV